MSACVYDEGVCVQTLELSRSRGLRAGTTRGQSGTGKGSGGGEGGRMNCAGTGARQRDVPPEDERSEHSGCFNDERALYRGLVEWNASGCIRIIVEEESGRMPHEMD